MRTLLYWTVLIILVGIRRICQLISLGLLCFWCIFILRLFIVGVDSGGDDTELIAFMIVLIAPLFLAPLFWWLSEQLRFDT